jgi:hypothetical protein
LSQPTLTGRVVIPTQMGSNAAVYPATQNPLPQTSPLQIGTSPLPVSETPSGSVVPTPVVFLNISLTDVQKSDSHGDAVIYISANASVIETTSLWTVPNITATLPLVPSTTASTSDNTQSSRISGGVIGGIVGGIAGVVASSILIYIRRRLKPKRKRRIPPHSETARLTPLAPPYSQTLPPSYPA